MEIKFITEGMACAKCEARVVEKLSSPARCHRSQSLCSRRLSRCRGRRTGPRHIGRSHRGFGIRRHRVIPRKKKRRMVLPSVFLFCRRSRLVSLQSTIGLFSKLKT